MPAGGIRVPRGFEWNVRVMGSPVTHARAMNAGVTNFPAPHSRALQVRV